MALSVPHSYHPRDLYILFGVIFLGLVSVVIFESYRASQIDRLQPESDQNTVTIQQPDLKVLEMLKQKTE